MKLNGTNAEQIKLTEEGIQWIEQNLPSLTSHIEKTRALTLYCAKRFAPNQATQTERIWQMLEERTKILEEKDEIIA